MLTKEQIIETLKEIDKEKYGIKKIGLFGSYAKGQATENSDVDILFERDYDSASSENPYDLKCYLEEKFKVKVDTLPLNILVREKKFYSETAKELHVKFKEDVLGSVLYA